MSLELVAAYMALRQPGMLRRKVTGLAVLTLGHLALRANLVTRRASSGATRVMSLTRFCAKAVPLLRSGRQSLCHRPLS